MLSGDIAYSQFSLHQVRLSGAIPVYAGDTAACPTSEIVHEITHPATCCLLLVVSRLTRGKLVDFDAAITVAHDANVPVVPVKSDGRPSVWPCRYGCKC